MYNTLIGCQFGIITFGGISCQLSNSKIRFSTKFLDIIMACCVYVASSWKMYLDEGNVFHEYLRANVSSRYCMSSHCYYRYHAYFHFRYSCTLQQLFWNVISNLYNKCRLSWDTIKNSGLYLQYYHCNIILPPRLCCWSSLHQ